jgi:acetyl-CoA carboxylase carboxyl transferase subunit beta
VSSPNKPALTPAPQPPAVPAPKKTLSLSDTDFLVEPAVTPPEAGTEVLPKKPKTVTSPTRRKDIPEGLWTKCPECEALIYDKELDENLKVCPKCGFHFTIGARERIHALVETCSFMELDAELTAADSLGFKGVSSYASKLQGLWKKGTLRDAVVTGIGQIGSHKAAIGVMDFAFLGGSMGAVVGEKLTRLIEAGTARGLPVIIISTSGGARMYEGMFSLMQMAKTCGALAYHAEKRLPFISVLVNPCYAGVMASFASVGDLILAEPGALIGFAGPRVIRDTTQADLPEGFQTAEFLRAHGLVDAIVPRLEMKARLSAYLDFMDADAGAAAK